MSNLADSKQRRFGQDDPKASNRDKYQNNISSGSRGGYKAGDREIERPRSPRDSRRFDDQRNDNDRKSSSSSTNARTSKWNEGSSAVGGWSKRRDPSPPSRPRNNDLSSDKKILDISIRGAANRKTTVSTHQSDASDRFTGSSKRRAGSPDIFDRFRDSKDKSNRKDAPPNKPSRSRYYTGQRDHIEQDAKRPRTDNHDSSVRESDRSQDRQQDDCSRYHSVRESEHSASDRQDAGNSRRDDDDRKGSDSRWNKNARRDDDSRKGSFSRDNDGSSKGSNTTRKESISRWDYSNTIRAASPASSIRDRDDSAAGKLSKWQPISKNTDQRNSKASQRPASPEAGSRSTKSNYTRDRSPTRSDSRTNSRYAASPPRAQRQWGTIREEKKSWRDSENTSASQSRRRSPSPTRSDVSRDSWRRDRSEKGNTQRNRDYDRDQKNTSANNRRHDRNRNWKTRRDDDDRWSSRENDQSRWDRNDSYVSSRRDSVEAQLLPRKAGLDSRWQREATVESSKDRIDQEVDRAAAATGKARIETPRAGAGEAYVSINQVGEGTYGQVFKARSELTGVLVALKKIRMESEKEGFPITAMREIKLLQALRHENVICLHEMMVTRGSIYMVFEYMEHDLNGILAHQEIKFTEAHRKSLASQLFTGLEYLHKKAVLHRDLKGSNILLNNQGQLKLADFGLARFYAKRRSGDYTNRVVTLWYRPPELLFGETQYGAEVDMWGAGCLYLELFVRKPVFQSEGEMQQLQAITDIMGPITPATWPGVERLAWYEMVKPQCRTAESDNSSTAAADTKRSLEPFQAQLPASALEVARGLLTYNPRQRWTATQALCANYFTEAPNAELPAGILSALDGEWHEYESRRARKKATAANSSGQKPVDRLLSDNTVILATTARSANP